MTERAGLRGLVVACVALLIVSGCRGRDGAPQEQGGAKPVQPSGVEALASGSASPAESSAEVGAGASQGVEAPAPLPSETGTASEAVTGAGGGLAKPGAEATGQAAANPFIGLTAAQLRTKMDEIVREEQALPERLADLTQKWSEGNAPADPTDALREADYKALNARTFELLNQRAQLEIAMDSPTSP